LSLIGLSLTGWNSFQTLPYDGILEDEVFTAQMRDDLPDDDDVTLGTSSY